MSLTNIFNAAGAVTADGHVLDDSSLVASPKSDLRQIKVSGKAATNYANITRAQYDDWLERFYPKQKELMESTQTGALLKEQLARVDENFDSANQAAQVANNNQLARYGIAASQDSSAQAKGALANVTSKNSLREYEKDRSMSVLSGSGKSNLSQLEV